MASQQKRVETVEYVPINEAQETLEMLLRALLDREGLERVRFNYAVED